VSEKTNALRYLDNLHIPYKTLKYETLDGEIDGKSVADKLGLSHEEIFKTLVSVGSSKDFFVFVIPVSFELDLKKASKAVGEKSITMLPLKDLLKTTGYEKGGCSPLGMKKHYTTVFDESIILLQKVTFNAGKVGLQVQLDVDKLSQAIEYSIYDLCKY